MSVNLGLISCGNGVELWGPLRVEGVRTGTLTLIRILKRLHLKHVLKKKKERIGLHRYVNEGRKSVGRFHCKYREKVY